MVASPRGADGADFPALHGLSQGYRAAEPAARPPRAPRPLRDTLAFLLAFGALHAAWTWARGSALERWVIDDCTVRTGAWLVKLSWPQAGAQAAGSRIAAPGGGINILSGCEGTEVLFLLWAALLAFPMPAARRALGMVLATGLVFGLNQARILVLFHALRADRASFDLLHGLIAPVVMIALSGLFFMLWIAPAQATPRAPAPRP
ncbi:exosortase/archaeosortase family protein [Methylibium sp.]|uniref:exosortase/archaeosortase family protein n=1 Tax=Methylibium sp. TaxID=2067992 RepID=UPI003D0D550C